MELELLKELVYTFGVSALSVFLLHRLKVPSIVGFILAGIIIGPYGFEVIEGAEQIETLAEVGIILLLFALGLEFSIAEIIKLGKSALLGGGLQVGTTIAVAAALAYPFVGQVNVALFVGFLVALSSTAIVLKMLSERGETDSPHGRAMLGVLIFQDLCLVPLMLLTSPLSGQGSPLDLFGTAVLKGFLIVAAVIVAARWLTPWVLHSIVRTRSSELFTISIILICLGIALLTAKFGLSLALGAFLAVLIISDSEYAYEALAKVLPFKDSFLGLFFVSIGMLLDVSYLLENLTTVALIVAAIFVLKVLLSWFAVFVAQGSFRVAATAGLGLAQVGEFSFVLAAVGKATGLMPGELYQVFLSSSIVTMAMAPFVIKASHPLAEKLSAWPLFRGLERMPAREHAPPELEDHVIIIGYGVVGRNLARTLKGASIPYVVVDLNSDVVRAEKEKGEAICFGDGTNRTLLRRLGIRRARLLLVAVSDAAATRNIIATAKSENRDLHIVVRTRYLKEVDDLIALGADEVIPEEFESSVEIFSRILHLYNVPRNIIDDFIEDVRKDSYRVFRTMMEHKKPFKAHLPMLSEIDSEVYQIRDNSTISGTSLSKLRFRTKTGATVMAVKRDGLVVQNPEPDFELQAGDIILLVGSRRDINRAMDYMGSFEPH